MNTMLDVLSAAEYLQSNQRSRKVFEAISRASVISGWALAKFMAMDPDELEPLLEEIRSHGLIEGDAQGLDALYFLSALGFRIGSFVS